MNKFKVGDKVQIKGGKDIWEIIEVHSGNSHNEYLCYQKGFNGHYGNYGSIKSENTGIGYDTNEYWFFREETLTLYQDKFPEIRITTDGKTTTAKKILNGEVIKEASVTLYYKDTFDFNIGCEEALKKLNTVPHLKHILNEFNLGEIGKLTDQTAIFGEKLYVGDVVEAYNTCTDEIDGQHIVAIDISIRIGGFITGFGNCKFTNGICDCYQIRKIKPYEDLKNGERIGYIEVVK